MLESAITLLPFSTVLRLWGLEEPTLSAAQLEAIREVCVKQLNSFMYQYVLVFEQQAVRRRHLTKNYLQMDRVTRCNIDPTGRQLRTVRKAVTQRVSTVMRGDVIDLIAKQHPKQATLPYSAKSSIATRTLRHAVDATIERWLQSRARTLMHEIRG